MATATPPRYCGTIKYRFQGTTYRDNVYLTAGKISCQEARGADFGFETSAATFPTEGWTCRYRNDFLWIVCTGAGSTVRSVPYAGGPSLPRHPRFCGTATYQAQGSTYQDKVSVLGGNVSCAGARRIDRVAETQPSGVTTNIPGWQCFYPKDGSYVLCLSPNSIVRGVSYTPPSPTAPVSTWPSCSNQYWGGGAFNVLVYNISCEYASSVVNGAFIQGTLTTQVGSFRCTRERNAENVVWLYTCLRNSGQQGLFFNTN